MRNSLYVRHQLRTAATYTARDFTGFEVAITDWLKYSITPDAGKHYGDVLHINQIYRGLFALEDGRVEAAKLHLLRATGVPASPVVKSFGPNMRLALELLQLGAHQVVLDYFDRCSRLWWLPFRLLHLPRWRRAACRGDIPDFRGNLYYLMERPPHPRPRPYLSY